MITVEELVIESLCHRLILISVKKQNRLHTKGGTHLDDEKGDALSGGGDEKYSSSQTGTGGGLGFLVMNAMHPHLKRAYGMTPTFHLGQNIPALTDSEIGQGENFSVDHQSEVAGNLLAQHGFEIDEDIKMILDTGEIQLMKTTLKSATLQVEMAPTWNFTPSLLHELNPTSRNSSDQTRMLMPRGISLDNCDNFSIVKLQDKRDMSGRSMVLVQTNEHRKDRQGRKDVTNDRKQLLKAKSLFETDYSKRSKSKKISATPTPVLVNQGMSVFVQGNDDLEEEIHSDETFGAGNDTFFHQQDEPGAPSVEVLCNGADIWDMLHGNDTDLCSDTNNRESNAVIKLINGSTSEFVSQSCEGSVDWNASKKISESPPKNFSGASSISPELKWDSGVSGILKKTCDSEVSQWPTEPSTMKGSYKLFNLDSDLECKVTPIELLPETSSIDRLLATPNADTITVPMAEVDFLVETKEVKLNIQDTDMKCIVDIPLQYVSTPSSMGNSKTANVPQNHLPSLCKQDELCMNNGRSDIDDPAFVKNATNSIAILESASLVTPYDRAIQDHQQCDNLKADVKLHYLKHDDYSLKNVRLPSNISLQCEKNTEGEKHSLETPPWGQKMYSKPEQAHEDSFFSSTICVQEDAKNFADHAELNGSSKQYFWDKDKTPSMESTYCTPPQSPIYQRVTEQSSTMCSDTRASCSQYSHREPHFSSTPRRTFSDSGHDSGISVALNPPSRLITYWNPVEPELMDYSGCTLPESSDGEDMCSVYELDLPYDEPQFNQHPNWMSDLPENLHVVPLTDLVIPGSHISLAIDRDMRMDMDFSKCNYEMAEFLRKLPNLAIFNNFRGLMKKIWKAWMPKQTLSIVQQLEAGVRYLDIRISKLRGGFYGEHGLYTRQLKRYLKEMREFLEEHPKEIIILHFGNLDQLDQSDKRHLVTTLFQTFGARLARSHIPGSTTMQFLWKHKKQVIVIFPDCHMTLLQNHIFYGLVWSDFEVVASYPKMQSVEELKSCLDDFDSEPSVSMIRVQAAADGKFHVFKAVLSPDMTMVFGEFKYKSMREMTQNETETVILRWINQRPKLKLNIVTFDFVGIGAAVSEVVMLNFSKRETFV